MGGGTQGNRRPAGTKRAIEAVTQRSFSQTPQGLPSLPQLSGKAFAVGLLYFFFLAVRPFSRGFSLGAGSPESTLTSFNSAC